MDSKLLPNKIKLIISEKVQNQSRWLCDRVHDKEWSGVLFYTTEGGEYGDPEFKITAQEIYLMDIGTTTYTEYTFGPDYIKMLMENPLLRKMHKGHVHSH